MTFEVLWDDARVYRSCVEEVFSVAMIKSPSVNRMFDLILSHLSILDKCIATFIVCYILMNVLCYIRGPYPNLSSRLIATPAHHPC